MPASAGRLLRLCRKELRETLRDRRTIVTLVLMPLLIYPLLSMTMNRFLLARGGSVLSGEADQGTVFRVQLNSPEAAEYLDALLKDPRSQPPPEILAAAGGLPPAKFEFYQSDTGLPEDNLRSGDVDLVVENIDGQNDWIRVVALAGKEASQQARRILIERTKWYSAAVNKERLEAVTGLPVEPALRLETSDISSSKQMPLLATVVPLMLVLMTITGAVYPAIDLTAGERERGTIEMVIASPISRSSILFAKYVAVVTVALLTALVNLFSMFITLWAGGLLEHLLGKDAPFPWVAILQVLALLVLFSGFFAAVLLALTSFARSFKEAQAYLIPLMLLSLAPGVLSLLPGIELNGILAVVPLVNIVLLTRELLSGGVAAVPAVAAILSTCAYAAAALGVAARLFGSDAVLRGSELSIGSIFARPEKPRDVPTVSAAAMMLAILFPIYFVASNLLGGLAGNPDSGPTLSMGSMLIINAAALWVLIGGIPWFVALVSKDRLRTTFRLKAPSPLATFGAFVIGLGFWAFAAEAFLIMEKLGIRSLDLSQVASAREAAAQMQAVSPWVILLALAVTPGVVEELCFRGYLFSAFRKQLAGMKTVLVTAALFGLFHVLTGSVLQLERFVPSTMTGIVLGWIALRTGSVLPGMLMHITHNAFLMLLVRYESWFQSIGFHVQAEQHLPATLLLVAFGCVVAGFFMVRWGTRVPSIGNPAPDIALEGK
ncbi:ABC-2 family transporter protein [Roseimaritima multifibrata]|uniref:ABC-2 family transporter protein n=1 Tax=Roseimaritima multifibrata TaxID=1930274 RepID=A0A517ML39_9BACT|nr:ABC transporter permease subunit/CPBP intramembrane protease [Roseimaritima multifibrata]QDS95608.1 ABC-2 family transporter protein [Roseimaritima multifibrata]